MDSEEPNSPDVIVNRAAALLALGLSTFGCECAPVGRGERLSASSEKSGFVQIFLCSAWWGVTAGDRFLPTRE
jgi:hypothetical protein